MAGGVFERCEDVVEWMGLARKNATVESCEGDGETLGADSCACIAWSIDSIERIIRLLTIADVSVIGRLATSKGCGMVAFVDAERRG
jgi:hypothetical protein